MLALLLSYPDRVTARRSNDPDRGVMVGGRGVKLEPCSTVRKAPLFLSVEIRDLEGSALRKRGEPSESRVTLASAIREEWLAAHFPHLYQQRDQCRFDPTRGKVTGVRETIFADLVLRSAVIGVPAHAPEAARALHAHLRGQGREIFQADAKAAVLLARMQFLRSHAPELGIPDFDASAIDEALQEACKGCISPEEVRTRPLSQILESRLTGQQRRQLESHAPETLTVPSGSRIRLTWPTEGGRPVLAARIQELFGLADTPRVAAGRVPVLLHLLGPNYRPVQITEDLHSFWNNTYPAVRKELRARYPRHPWPEDPWNAPPVAVGQRKKP